MNLIVKHFNELSGTELVDIYKLRVAVFVVEQNAHIRKWMRPIKSHITFDLKMRGNRGLC